MSNSGTYNAHPRVPRTATGSPQMYRSRVSSLVTLLSVGESHALRHGVSQNVRMIQRTVVGTGLYSGDLGTPAGMGLTIRRGARRTCGPDIAARSQFPRCQRFCMAIECFEDMRVGLLCCGMPAAFAYFWTSLQNCCRQIANSGSLEFDFKAKSMSGCDCLRETYILS